MIVKVATKIGSTQYQFEFDEKSEMDALNKAAVLGNPPQKCDECGQDELFKLDSNRDKEGNTYVNVICLNEDCKAKAKLGQYKTGGYFWHKFERWVPKETREKLDRPTKREEREEDVDLNDIPF